MVLTSCGSKFKYIIKDKDGDVYLCNFYTKNSDGCIMFKDKPGIYTKNGSPTKLCEGYTIKKN